METKKYSSYAQIEREPEILKIEKKSVIKIGLWFSKNKGKYYASKYCK
jgi:hypothetical protein